MVAEHYGVEELAVSNESELFFRVGAKNVTETANSLIAKRCDEWGRVSFVVVRFAAWGQESKRTLPAGGNEPAGSAGFAESQAALRGGCLRLVWALTETG